MPEESKFAHLLEWMMKKRTLVLEGKVTAEKVNDLIFRMLHLQHESSDPITLLIDSGGGHINSAMKLCDFMTSVLHAPVKGVVVGMCGSSATYILLHCNTRVGTKYSRYVIHSGRKEECTIPVNGSVDGILEQLRTETKRLEKVLTQMYRRKLKISKKEAAALFARGDQTFDAVMWAKEAVKIGLIETIIKEKLPIFA